jgi:polysaccharide export outer membrane protein
MCIIFPRMGRVDSREANGSFMSRTIILSGILFSLAFMCSPWSSPAAELKESTAQPLYEAPSETAKPALAPQFPGMVREKEPVSPPKTETRHQEEELSGFEQFVSGVLEITDAQFELLKKDSRISFARTPIPVPAGQIMIPVRILQSEVPSYGQTPKEQDLSGSSAVPIGAVSGQAPAAKKTTLDAGYLVGITGEVREAFRIAGIKSPLFISDDVRQFGYDLFRNPPSTFAPANEVPVGPDYVLGPGDEIIITVWGKIEGQWDVAVNRDGTVSLPKIGVLGVTGLTFEELKELLHKELSKYYTGFQMSVSMGALRTIKVYVVGSARFPGAYTVSSLSTLVSALFEAGGPAKTGSMRDIELKRNGETVVHFDMYDFLLKGDKTKDARLMPEDVIFIPAIGPVAAIKGSVNRPAIYELKGDTTVSELIDMAGGLSDIAFRGRAQIERIVDNSRQSVLESFIDEARDVRLKPGDIVRVFAIVQDRRVVRLSGAVQREGEYGLKPGMTVRDLVAIAGGLKYYAYDREAELTRVSVTEEGPVTEKVTINLKKALEGDAENNIALKEEDYLFIRTVPEWRLYQTVSVMGEVRFPGVFTIKKGERLSSIIERAGGYTENAYLRGSVFTRSRVQVLQQRQLDEMVDRLERELLGAGTAEVAAAFSAEEAKIKEFELKQKREFIEKLKTVRAKGRMVLELDTPEKLRGTIYDIELEEGDSLYIPSNPGSVQVVGSVYNQTAFVYDDEKGYSDYVDLAGGYTENADKKRAYILKTDGTAVRASSVARGNMEPGDTVVVPEKLERVAWLRATKDITQILYQIAVSAGVLIVAF